MRRYDFIDEYEYGLREMREAIDGDFVKYEESMTEINRLEKELKRRNSIITTMQESIVALQMKVKHK